MINIIRDKIKDEAYFNNYVGSTTDRKRNYITRIEGLDDPKQGFINSSTTLDLFSRNILIAKYSQGEDIEKLIGDFKESVKWFELTYNSTAFYVQMLWMLSIGILLKIEQSEFDKLVELVKKDDPNDYIIDFLINSRYNWGKQSSDVKFETPYKALVDVITLAQTDKQRSVERLKQYLDKEWYKGHSDAGWYDSHKNKHNTYAGYWSWESGALVIVLGLDDSSLKDQQYYPYDMVHWNR
ncbi:PoNi-like cognate immunity protein [Mucilaginibacter sp. KACC 22063]|uniref:PoNi-like cognate immunity protein n=1 Tax=Mucilaginibacter sp. KACC 22063 TaxID=3025666 RepID=UPI002366E02A|nr:PoNi-like cognate immunity protein [Mucilaginibacter sp. KACC 22063]WDF54384.1 DUF1911 domain-containing protein [Mucilaginibacter sp. KACC 22063]